MQNADLLVEFEETPPSSDLILSWRTPDETDDDQPATLTHADIDAGFSAALTQAGYQRNQLYNVLLCRRCEICVRAEPAPVRLHSFIRHGVQVRPGALRALNGFGAPRLHWIRSRARFLVRPVVGVRIEIGYRCDICALCCRDAGAVRAHFRLEHPLAPIPDPLQQQFVQTMSEVNNYQYFCVKLDMRASIDCPSQVLPRSPDFVRGRADLPAPAPAGDRRPATSTPSAPILSATELSAFLYTFPDSAIRLDCVSERVGAEPCCYTPLYFSISTPEGATDAVPPQHFDVPDVDDPFTISAPEFGSGASWPSAQATDGSDSDWPWLSQSDACSPTDGAVPATAPTAPDSPHPDPDTPRSPSPFVLRTRYSTIINGRLVLAPPLSHDPVISHPAPSSYPEQPESAMPARPDGTALGPFDVLEAGPRRRAGKKKKRTNTVAEEFADVVDAFRFREDADAILD